MEENVDKRAGGDDEAYDDVGGREALVQREDAVHWGLAHLVMSRRQASSTTRAELRLSVSQRARGA